MKDSQTSTTYSKSPLSLDSLLQSINLPLNFTLKECGGTTCPDNAYAKMDGDGQRIILYDDKFLQALDRNELRHQSLAALAHEIGHHLAGHILFIVDGQYADAIAACEENIDDSAKCDNEQRAKYLKYLHHRRTEEGEADRFAGYIMHSFGVPLEEVLSLLRHNSISNENDDTLSTHPKRSKRLAAAEAGYLLAVSDKAHPEREIDLVKIKGRSYRTEIYRTPKMRFAKVVNQIRSTLTSAISTVSKDYDYEMTTHSSYLGNMPSDVRDRTQQYQNEGSVGDTTGDSSTEFQLLSMATYSQYNENIGFHPYVGCHVQDGILSILTFYDTPKVIYRSPYDASTISYPEIEAIFVELIGMKVAESVETHNEAQGGVSKLD